MITISEILIESIRNSGMSDRTLGIRAKVNRQSIARFVSGQTSLTLEQAERLAIFFGLELHPAKSSNKGKGLNSGNSST